MKAPSFAPNLSPYTNPLVARLEPYAGKHALADTRVIPTKIVGRYVGLGRELGLDQAGVT